VASVITTTAVSAQTGHRSPQGSQQRVETRQEVGEPSLRSAFVGMRVPTFIVDRREARLPDRQAAFPPLKPRQQTTCSIRLQARKPLAGLQLRYRPICRLPSPPQRRAPTPGRSHCRARQGERSCHCLSAKASLVTPDARSTRSAAAAGQFCSTGNCLRIELSRSRRPPTPWR
jgi:hypothetical protein